MTTVPVPSATPVVLPVSKAVLWLAGTVLIAVALYPGFPADMLFLFRFYSVAAQLILWTTIALVFGPLAERLLAPKPAADTVAQPLPVA